MVEFSGQLIFDAPRPREGEVRKADSAARTPVWDGQHESKPGDLDSHKANEIHTRLLAIYRAELERQADNRAEMATDEDFYDHQQWTAEEAQQLMDRGQAPLVFNLIQTSTNWLLGSQRRATMDFKVLPRRKDGLDAAQRKTELLRHVRDENHADAEGSLVFADQVKAGVGWFEAGEGDPADGPIVVDAHTPWRQMLFDSRSAKADFSDGRYVSRTKWLDLDVAATLWPKRLNILEHSTEGRIMAGDGDIADLVMDSVEDDSGTAFSQITAGGRSIRERIRVIEMWFKMPMMAEVISGGQFNRELFDPWSEGHFHDLQSGRARLVTRPREVVHVAMMTELGLLSLDRSHFRHNRFPFTPAWGYRRAATGLPYGFIRGLRDLNRDLNKRASKALWHLSATRVYVEEGSVEDIEEVRDEAARPDAVITYKQGRQPPRMEQDKDLAQAHINLMSLDAGMIQQVGGVTDENMGRRTNATSGKAIIARQDQGQLATSVFFDNFRAARAIHGEKLLVNIEQFYTDEQEFRITDERGNPQYITINDGEPGNSIGRFKSDFILSEEDWRASTRQAQAEQLLKLMQQLAATAPGIVMQTLDLAVESLDVPKRDELVKRIRQVTGVSDPDEDPNNPSPETIARMQEMQRQQQIQERAMNAEIEEKEARVAKLRAETGKIGLGLEGASVDTLKRAVETATQLGYAPQLARAVDEILMSAQQQAQSALVAPQSQPEMPTQPEIPPEPAMQGEF